ncbi:MAG: 30S ribosomal protein S3 [Candidatus Nealsonbacteria bacterium]|nr:30S ribosomal protein S3 [Candidatus Nealsonbacteria bacterium]
MSHKVNPKIFRIRGMGDWHSRGFYEKDFSSYLEEDFKIREFLDEELGEFGLARIDIERYPGKMNVVIHTSRPGLVIGRGGERIKEVRKKMENNVLEKTKGEKKVLNLEVKEIKNPWKNATLVAKKIAEEIERRTPYRRVLKRNLSKAMSQKGVKGAKLQVAGRLNGISIARTEWLSEGELPRQTWRANIDYAFEEAYCTYGVIGIKVWIYKGEEFEE